jgi:hypothetical protein
MDATSLDRPWFSGEARWEGINLPLIQYGELYNVQPCPVVRDASMDWVFVPLTEVSKAVEDDG